MFNPTSRLGASRLAASAAFAALAIFGATASTAAAAENVEGIVEGAVKPAGQATQAVNAALAVCPGQTFSRPFTELGDPNYYTLVPGSEGQHAGAGWELLNGASVTEAALPSGGTGGTLDLPAGAVAISPPVCVTLQYPTARVWWQSLAGAGSVRLIVTYGASRTLTKLAGALTAQGGSGWQLSAPLNVSPELGGSEEGAREVRFVYAAGGKNAHFELGGLYVDPRFGW